jgi:hypothetical protein
LFVHPQDNFEKPIAALKAAFHDLGTNTLQALAVRSLTSRSAYTQTIALGLSNGYAALDLLGTS